MYSALMMLYATHVIEDKVVIDKVPEVIRKDVQEIVDDATKKDESGEA